MKFLFVVFAFFLNVNARAVAAERAMPKVDYLLVLDDSQSFSNLRALASRRFDGFLDRLRAAGWDYQVAMTTTSCLEGTCGKLYGPVPVITNRTPQAVQNFNLNLAMALENEGSDLERGFDATLAALQGHPDFHRPDARLIVTVVTSEDDHSAMGVADFMKSMGAASPSPRGWQMDFIGAIDAYECSSPAPGTVEPGERYMSVAGRTSGLAIGLCSNRRRF